MLAIIGGTGLYDLAGMQISQEHAADTPFGRASGAGAARPAARPRDPLPGAPRRRPPAAAARGELPRQRVRAQTRRCDADPRLLGRRQPGRSRGTRRSGDAVAVLRLDARRARAQLLRRRRGGAHRPPRCRSASNLVAWAAGAAKRLDITLHTGLTYACVEGPRLGTRAESHFMRSAGCHLVGMTNVPEVFLAREAQICYATVGIVTDYDCWMDDPAQHVSVSCASRALRREPDQGPAAARRAAGDAAAARGARDPLRAAKRIDHAGRRTRPRSSATGSRCCSADGTFAGSTIIAA